MLKQIETSDSYNLPRLRARRVHAYAASFTDEIANELISSYTKEGEICLDPFSGAATSLIQARLLKRSAIGIDIDPIACLIARVVTTSYSIEDINAVYEKVTGQLAEVKIILEDLFPNSSPDIVVNSFPFNHSEICVPNDDNISFWFAPIQRALLAALVYISKSINDPKNKRIIDLAISSAIIHKWPYTLSQARDIDHSRPHRVLRDNLTVDSQIQIFYRALNNILRSLRKLNKLSTTNVDLKVIEDNAVEAINKLEPASIHYVITSPPYFNAIDYPRSHKFSQRWLWPQSGHKFNRKLYIGLKAGKAAPGLAEAMANLIPSNVASISPLEKISRSKYFALCQYVNDLDSIINGIAYVLKPKRNLSFILSNNIIGGAEVPIVDIVIELLRRRGFQAITAEKRKIMPNRRRYPFGIRGFKGLMENEYIINAIAASK